MRALITLIILVVATCQSVVAGEIADLHHRLAVDKPAAAATGANVRGTPAPHSITEIGIERAACYGTCPMYTFVVKSDGTCRYRGDDYVERKGQFAGTVPVWRFNQLARFIAESGFLNLRRDYDLEVTDHPSVYTMVVVNGERKVIRNYANAGPPTLWAVEELIDALLAKAEWDDKATPERR
jgi:hypothetical protein